MIDNDDYLINAEQINNLNRDIYLSMFQNGHYKKIFNGTIVKRKVLKKYQLEFLPVNFYEDFLIIQTLCDLVEKEKITLGLFGKPLYYYRQNPKSYCYNTNYQEKINELYKIKKYLKEEIHQNRLDFWINRYQKLNKKSNA